MLTFTIFIAGMTSLAIEVAASRLLGNVFGTSNLVWANIIGLILLYLTLGYFIGGRWADRSPNEKTFYQLLCWAAFTVGLIPAASRPILLWAVKGVETLNAPVAGGSFIATLLLFFIPVTLLGCVSPFAIRLSSQNLDRIGNSSGRIYAISTLGSLVGTFFPVLVIIPTLGTARTYLFFAFLLFLISWIGLWRADRRRALMLLWMPIVLVGVAATTAGTIKPTQGLLHETESAYNFIQVVERRGTRYLLLNEGQGLHSVYNPTQLITNGTWDYFLVAPYFNAPPYTPANVTSLALVGLAAGTIPKQYTAVYGGIPIDGFEIDPEIVRVGRDYFDMNEPNLNLIVEDGRWGLTHSKRKYTVIGVDAYRLPYIPPHLTTIEFFQEVKAHLEDRGALTINVGRTPNDRRLIDAMSSTLRELFPSVYVMDVPGTFNSIIVATMQPTSEKNLQANFILLPPNSHPLLVNSLQRGVDTIKPTQYSDTIFSDDYAPIEQLTNSIVINFVLGEGLQFLK